MALKTHKELIVWQKAMDLTVEIYRLTEKFPKNEHYGIILQLRKAAVSIPSNIAEGYGRKSSKEYYHHLSIAYGSGLEVDTQLILSKRLQFAHVNEFIKSEALLDEVSRMLNTMTLKNKLA